MLGDCKNLFVRAFFCNFGAVKAFYSIYLLAAAAFFVASCGCSKNTAKVAPAASKPAQEVPAFNADSAYANVARQVAFGPRIANSEAHERCAQWLIDELTARGADTVMVQRANLPEFGPMVNILGRFNSSAARRILLLSHWDSRPWADNDPNPANHSKPIDGANDGASGVGVLLEVARIIGKHSPHVGVDILFVDAEDAGNEGDDDSWARGTQYWVQDFLNKGELTWPEYAILLDMVGGRDAVFPREMFSNYHCGELNDRLWRLAAANGMGARFPNRVGGAVNDDHLPLLRAGIRAIDIIETDHPQTGSFNPTWHTLDDNLENIDKNTLGDVGRLITLFIYNEPQ